MPTTEPAQTLISLSVAPAISVMGKKYYDLPAIIALMRQLRQDAVVDGFEFQNLAEWDAAEPPRDEREQRLAAWEDSPKHCVEEIAARLQEAKLPILSVHANRDVGICLCSNDPDSIARGKRLAYESFQLAERIGATLCVLHLWNTWKETFDPVQLYAILDEVTPRFPFVRAAVENIPTHLSGYTPFDMVQSSEWITLDLRWAALYHELDKFEISKDRIANVHLRGRLAGQKWVIDNAPFDFYEALTIIREKWGYQGLWTLEPEDLRGGSYEDLAAAMATLRANIP